MSKYLTVLFQLTEVVGGRGFLRISTFWMNHRMAMRRVRVQMLLIELNRVCGAAVPQIGRSYVNWLTDNSVINYKPVVSDYSRFIGKKDKAWRRLQEFRFKHARFKVSNLTFCRTLCRNIWQYFFKWLKSWLCDCFRETDCFVPSFECWKMVLDVQRVGLDSQSRRD